MKVSLLLMLGLLLSAVLVQGDVPHLISYQGILKDSTGTPVADDVYYVKFSIYDDSADGSLLWQSGGFVPIQTNNGLFNYVLGSNNLIPDSIAQFSNLWLAMNIEEEPEYY